MPDCSVGLCLSTFSSHIKHKAAAHIAKAFVIRVPKPKICTNLGCETQHIVTVVATTLWKDSD